MPYARDVKAPRKSRVVFWSTIAVLTVAAVAVAIPGFRTVAVLERERQAKDRLHNGSGPCPGYLVVPSPIGPQAVPERYPETGRYTFFIHPDLGVLKLNNGGKIVERVPSDAELGIRRPPPK